MSLVLFLSLLASAGLIMAVGSAIGGIVMSCDGDIEGARLMAPLFWTGAVVGFGGLIATVVMW